MATVSAADLIKNDQSHLIHPLHHASEAAEPLVVVEGRGATIKDIQGNEYIDGLSGLWNVSVGHGREELARDLPEVDHFLGSSDMLKLETVLKGQADRILVGNPADWVVSATDPRRISTRGRSAYVKIAEGCNRTCAFCVIPELRGKQRSRQPDDIVREVEELASRGILEVNLVSQDTIAYGRDLDERSNLAALVKRIADVPGLLARGVVLAEQLDAITRDGLVLAPQTVADINRAEARRNRWTAAALWVIAALLVALLLL